MEGNQAGSETMVGRRMGPPDATVRFDLLDATERVLARDGYPAVTSRNVGREAGVDQKLVFYYFRTMEELVVATFHRRSEDFLARLREAATSTAPLREIWALISDRSGRLTIEFMAMATRNAALKTEVRAYNRAANAIIEEGLARQPRPAGTDPALLPPAFVNFMLASLARNLLVEEEIGLTPPPDEMRALIEEWIARLGA